ncbi:hypothetical protein [Natrialba aegyptia]|uniref:Uncharacterized protein n=1 Tax=Natrialba aegyptia DSM 13077 TaxID=1227491 RepID=M0AKV9_9EURY|nr:hypothetical protein [Natrialba aegyptia]ELY98552.1 hypothetical protein C480_21189 [Natrialba aegyptia DSM 13077]
MVVVELKGSISVEMTTGDSKPCKYTVMYEGEQVAQYETSADPRTTGGRIGLRNIVCRHVSGVDKNAIDEWLSTEISQNAEALSNEFGTR